MNFKGGRKLALAILVIGQFSSVPFLCYKVLFFIYVEVVLVKSRITQRKGRASTVEVLAA
jgi:hypothetical protein